MRKLLQFDWILLGSIFFLGSISILSLYSMFSGDSVHEGYIMRQLIFAILGVAIMLFIAFLDYRHIQKYSTVFYFGIIVVLCGVLLFGSTIRGTEGWIEIGALRLQPVEITKPILILFLASFISKKRTELDESVRLVVSFILAFILIGLVLKQPDLGSALVLTGIWIGMTLISGIRLKHFLLLMFVGCVVVVSSWFVLAPYQKSRIMTVLEPQSDPKGSGYNVIQATVAIGSGGLLGKGVGHGSQSQLDFLPEKHTDFIFSVISEELGLLGSLFVLTLYGIILYRLRNIALQSRDNFGYLLVAGVMIMIFIQVVVNIGMNVGVLPVTGIPLPLLSYGGSAFLGICASFGLVLSVFLRKKEESFSTISSISL